METIAEITIRNSSGPINWGYFNASSKTILLHQMYDITLILKEEVFYILRR